MSIALAGAIVVIATSSNTDRSHRQYWPLIVCAVLLVAGFTLWILRDKRDPHIVTFSPQIIPVHPEREFADSKPGDILKAFRDNTAIQAQKLVQPYIGKWMRITGQLDNVGAWGFTGSSSVHFKEYNILQQNFVSMRFNDKNVVEGRLAVLPRGTHMTVVGKIQSIDTHGIFLEMCEIESVKVDSPPQST